MEERYKRFFWWLKNCHTINTYTHRVQDHFKMRQFTLDQAWDYWTKNIEMRNETKTGEWYTHNNGTVSHTFFCKAIDGEYLFETENINGPGYSILLCVPATDEEILEACKYKK